MSEKTDVWMPLFIGDYLRDTNRLTTEQHGAYLLLIMDYWTNGAPPDEDDVLASITRLSTAAWKKSRPAISRLFRISDGAWHHKRIEEELKNAAENSKKNTERAKKAAAKRWQKQSLDDAPSIAPSIAPSNAQEVLDKCPSPSPSPSVNPNPLASSVPISTVGTPAGAVCARLRSEAKIADAVPHHPKLLALLEAGLTADEIVAAGMDAKGKGFAWVLATAEGRRRDADKIKPLPSAKPSRHTGFDKIDYRDGITAEWRF